MAKVIDPYGSELVGDYEKLIKEFGMEVYDNEFPEPNRLMRRGVVFGGRDIKLINKCIREKKPYYALSGIMPSNNEIHLGNKMVVENLAYFQKHGAKVFILVADLEAQAARDVPLEEGRKRALEFHIPAYLALGLDSKKTVFYFQSDNKKVIHHAYRFAQKVTLNEFKAVYGNADPGRIFSALTQIGDVLYPQFEKRMPGVIPVGVDQDPHIRLSRDVVNKMKREKFFPPASIYHKYTPSLDGSMKMSKSQPMSCITLPEDPGMACRKIKRALTGGRDTLEEQKRLGAVIEKDMVFELLKQHLVEDDKELEKIYRAYKSGEMMSGEIKELACEKMTSFLKKFDERFRKAQKQVGKLDFVEF